MGNNFEVGEELIYGDGYRVKVVLKTFRGERVILGVDFGDKKNLEGKFPFHSLGGRLKKETGFYLYGDELTLSRPEKIDLEKDVIKPESASPNTVQTSADPDEHFLKEFRDVKRVIRSGEATIVILKDGRKGVVRLQKGDAYDRRIGFFYAYVKALKRRQ